MDPYCRARVGVQVFETQTAYNGAKNPRWNKLTQCHVSENLESIQVGVFLDILQSRGVAHYIWGVDEFEVKFANLRSNFYRIKS